MSSPPHPLAPASATVSLGKPGGHSIESILKASSNAGLKGIEICYNNLHHHAQTLQGDSKVDQSALVEAAKDIKQQCDELDLTIIVLQPFAFYDGLVSTEIHMQMVAKFSNWIELAHALGCDIIQMPSNFQQTGTTGDMDRIVADLQEIADLALQTDPVIRIAYEAVAWGTHIDHWEQSWEVVKMVGRWNVGLCLDTFHIASKVWADPTSRNGKRQNGDAEFAASLSRMARKVEVERIFYVQLSDAEMFDPPFDESHEFYNPTQPVHMSWSRNARLFPFEEHLGGYMPVVDIARTIVNELGYRRWISMEIFSRHLLKSDEEIPAEFAGRAMQSYGKVREALGWEELQDSEPVRDRRRSVTHH